MTLIPVQRPDGPGTHVLIIGVGTYPHLPGGNGSLAEESFELKQLSSPPRSARVLVTWFLKNFQNPEAPLASLDLVVSPIPGVANQYYSPVDGKTYTVNEPSKAEITSALRSWFERANSNPKNVALLFFCGHGLRSRAGETELLACDYGADALAGPMSNAINFNSIVAGMENCAASKQAFFVDACRGIPEGKTVEEIGQGDKNILRPPAAGKQVKQSQYIYYATKDKFSAGSDTNQESWFTQALCSAVKGMGATNADGESWVVNTLSLAVGLDSSFRLSRTTNEAIPEPASECRGESFQIHYLIENPIIPVKFYPNRDIGKEGYLQIIFPNNLTAKYNSILNWNKYWLLELEACEGVHIGELFDIPDPPDKKKFCVHPSRKTVRF